MQAFESEESDDGSPLETFEDETRQEANQTQLYLPLRKAIRNGEIEKNKNQISCWTIPILMTILFHR